MRGIYSVVYVRIDIPVDTAHPERAYRALVSAEADLKTGLTAHTALIAHVETRSRVQD
jgi:hypothetical protein